MVGDEDAPRTARYGTRGKLFALRLEELSPAKEEFGSEGPIRFYDLEDVKLYAEIEGNRTRMLLVGDGGLTVTRLFDIVGTEEMRSELTKAIKLRPDGPPDLGVAGTSQRG